MDGCLELEEAPGRLLHRVRGPVSEGLALLKNRKEKPAKGFSVV
jgi:hypothetical protein